MGTVKKLEMIELMDNTDEIKVSSFFSANKIADIRKKYEKRSLDLCDELAIPGKLAIQGQKILNSVITFRNLDRGDQILTIYDYINNQNKAYKTYSVIFMGRYILDPLNSNNLLESVDYIDALYDLGNEHLQIDNQTSYWYDERGHRIVPDIDYIYGYGLNSKKYSTGRGKGKTI